MKLVTTGISGVMRALFEPSRDERGAFSRYFDAEIFEKSGLCATFSQGSFASNERAGTVRGLHFQAEPAREVKIVRCARGRIFDVLLDVRKTSSTYGMWRSFELSESSNETLYVPEGVAHGYQTLTDNAIVEYLISGQYVSSLQRGFRWNSEPLAIPWPLPVTVLSTRDRELPTFQP